MYVQVLTIKARLNKAQFPFVRECDIRVRLLCNASLSVSCHNMFSKIKARITGLL